MYIRNDIILKLVEHDELNQSKLMSCCGFNNVKHEVIVDEMVDRSLIVRIEEAWGATTQRRHHTTDSQAIQGRTKKAGPRSTSMGDLRPVGVWRGVSRALVTDDEAPGWHERAV